jgi:hypothetical protein
MAYERTDAHERLYRWRVGWFREGWTPVPVRDNNGRAVPFRKVRLITDWCEEDSLPGEFSWHPDYLSIAFSDANAALAFRMRWR